MIDQIRASKLPSNMMQFAARGAMQVSAAENIEILVHLALHNKVFGELARMTLAGWDEKACLAAVSDPKTPVEVLHYFISPDNLRPTLLPALLENPSVTEGEIAKLARSAMRDTIEIMLKSQRLRSLRNVLENLKSNPYVKKEETAELSQPSQAAKPVPVPAPTATAPAAPQPAAADTPTAEPNHSAADELIPAGDAEHEEAVKTYMSENASEIAAEGDKKFQSVGGVVELLGEEYYPITLSENVPETAEPAAVASATQSAASAATAVAKAAKKPPATAPQRQNTLQKINSLDVKGRIQLALKGNKEERSILIRDGTKVVALAVLEAPKLSDGEVEKFASQKNVLEAVLRQIPLKRRFMKNYVVVRNLVANPRTPLDLGLGLIKHLLAQDLKNISANKDVSETIRKMALKMFKQKTEAANKK
ncbi:MAG TPA: hypothetical protein VMH04_01475 [Candidatus Solibacter sp.]|nr:hypothetical protein [Candidatus Solibacter sp.]